MSRWGKHIVVPLDTLCEKETTNRPTVAKSVGTVGKWGKMGFTSTRTYALSALPAAVAAAAAAAVSPGLSPISAREEDLSPSVPEPPKPRKFFKSRNTAPPEVIAQIIQQLPRTSISPSRESANATSNYHNLSPLSRDAFKNKTTKISSAERKKKSPKKPLKTNKTDASKEDEKSLEEIPKPKKKKEEKKLKPEAPPSRIIARARKVVNYCEEDDERILTPIKDIITPKGIETNSVASELPPPPAPAAASTSSAGSISASPAHTTPKTPEHPPIVLRISKGTSRLLSTDSEDLPGNSAASPQQNFAESTKTRYAFTEENSAAANTATTPKVIVKPPKPPTPDLSTANVLSNANYDNAPEINYCTVKISPDKPPKERLKLIIKTDVIRNAIAAAAAAEAAKAAANAERLAATATAAGNDAAERPEKEKKQKSKKHKHSKQSSTLEQLTPVHAITAESEFKVPSPHLAVAGFSAVDSSQLATRSVISPPTLSDKDFDSQSSVLGSISSKGNSTPQLLHQHQPQEESFVVHSRGSSVITSDLETSQHSSLVAAPSDIESRLESMMMDGEASQQRATTSLLEEEPLQEDILAVLQGDETNADEAASNIKVNGTPAVLAATENNATIAAAKEDNMQRRITRGRGRPANNSKMETETLPLAAEEKTPPETTIKTRGRKPAQTANVAVVAADPVAEEAFKRTTRRGLRKANETSPAAAAAAATTEKKETTETLTTAMIVEEQTAAVENGTNNETPSENTPPVTRRGRLMRSVNNNSLNNNNNINKIVANLSAKAGAVEETKGVAAEPFETAATTTTTVATQKVRSYGRKRKNQQVTQVLQPSVDDKDEHTQATPAKLANIENNAAMEGVETTSADRTNASSTAQADKTLQDCSNYNNVSMQDANSTAAPIRDYKIKDKFKRTLTLDNQVNCETVAPSPTEQLTTTGAANANANSCEDEQQRGSMKLVITKKKGSIFKSRALGPTDTSEQATASKRHLYKHSWDAQVNGDSASHDTQDKVNETTEPSARSAADNLFDDFSEDLPIGNNSALSNASTFGKMTRVIKNNPQAAYADLDAASDNVTSLKVDRKAKDFYTVVRNVKTAHQIQEIGEYQEMDDDVEYILDALQPQNPTATRCLSALQLATKCMTPAFRMHVRAHSVVTKFFKALSDANTDLSLGLCTSAIMFILSQEGLNMDLDRDSLELMMNLLEVDDEAASSDRSNYLRNRQKVRELCEEMKAQGKATHLNVDTITVGTLAMETLLSLTSKRAGDWFKEELRELGGLEHIIKTISDSCRQVNECMTTSTAIVWTQPLLDNMQTVERCLRVLENVTQMNEENQKYMLTYMNGEAINTLCTLYRLCDQELRIHPTTESTSKDNPGVVMRTLLIPLMKVLINLTHTFEPLHSLGADLLGKRVDVIDTSFHLLLQMSKYIPDRCVFELNILVLLLLINLSMFSVPNRAVIMKAHAPPAAGSHRRLQPSKMTAIEAVMDYFYKCEELARLVEKNTDAILDNPDKNKKKQEEVDETVNNLLQKAGHHMEHTLKGSYAGILIGHLITDNEEYESIVRSHLRGNGFKEIISVLEKYYTFMNLTASSEASIVAHIKSTKKLIDYFKKRDLMHNDGSDNALPLNLETHHSSDNTERASAATLPSTSRSAAQRTYQR